MPRHSSPGSIRARAKATQPLRSLRTVFCRRSESSGRHAHKWNGPSASRNAVVSICSSESNVTTTRTGKCVNKPILLFRRFWSVAHFGLSSYTLPCSCPLFGTEAAFPPHGKLREAWPARVLVHIHGGVGRTEQAVPGGSVFRIDGDAYTCRPVQSVPVDGKWLVETVLQAEGDLLCVAAAADQRHQCGKLVSAEPRQHVGGAELALHSLRHILQIQIAHSVAVDIVDLLELVEINVDESEDSRGFARLLDQGIEILFQREAVVDVGELVELRSMAQIGKEPPRFDGQRCQLHSCRKRVLLVGQCGRLGFETGGKHAQGGARSGCNLHARNAQPIGVHGTSSEPRSADDIAPAGGAE